MDEAVAVFEAMVLVPLGLHEPGQRYQNNWDVRCHGLAEWFDYEASNSKTISSNTENYSLRKKELEDKMLALEETKKATDMKIAILSQFRMFVSDET